MKIDNFFDIGNIVYLKHDEDQKPRMVISIEVFAAGELMYRLISGTVEAYHYDFEMNKEKKY